MKYRTVKQNSLFTAHITLINTQRLFINRLAFNRAEVFAKRLSSREQVGEQHVQFRSEIWSLRKSILYRRIPLAITNNPVFWSYAVYVVIVVSQNQLSSKLSSCQWLVTPWRPCDVIVMQIEGLSLKHGWQYSSLSYTFRCILFCIRKMDFSFSE